MDKRMLEQYVQCMRESEDLKDRIEFIDAEIQSMDSEGGASIGFYESDRRTALLQLRTSYEKMRRKLASMTVSVDGYIRGIEDGRMRQIMTLRYSDTKNGRQLTWLEIAQRMHETEDSCRKAHDRWLMDDAGRAGRQQAP